MLLVAVGANYSVQLDEKHLNSHLMWLLYLVAHLFELQFEDSARYLVVVVVIVVVVVAARWLSEGGAGVGAGGELAARIDATVIGRRPRLTLPQRVKYN